MMKPWVKFKEGGRIAFGGGWKPPPPIAFNRLLEGTLASAARGAFVASWAGWDNWWWTDGILMLRLTSKERDHVLTTVAAAKIAKATTAFDLPLPPKAGARATRGDLIVGDPSFVILSRQGKPGGDLEMAAVEASRFNVAIGRWEKDVAFLLPVGNGPVPIVQTEDFLEGNVVGAIAQVRVPGLTGNARPAYKKHGTWYRRTS